MASNVKSSFKIVSQNVIFPETGAWCRLVDTPRHPDVHQVASRLWDLHVLVLPCAWSLSHGYEDRADVVEADGFEVLRSIEI